jgi:hypothetical protein
VVGYAPMPSADAVGYFRESYPKLGYRIGSGDAEMVDAEAAFFGHGTRGRWRVNALTNCPGATFVTIAAAERLRLPRTASSRFAQVRCNPRVGIAQT